MTKNKTLRKTVFILMTISILSCSSAKQTTEGERKEETKKEEKLRITSFEAYLSRLPGVNVVGEGSSAIVTVRGGNNSVTASSEPLFILNGQQLNGGFAEVFGLIEVDNIKTVNILKTISEIAPYGVRGSNGVVEIITK